MTLIQIGPLTVNLDRVTSICDLSTVDASGQVIPGALRLGFEGGDFLNILQNADALRTWLAANSQKVAS